MSVNHYIVSTIIMISLNDITMIRDLKVDGCPSKENLFGQSALLMNATYIVFS